MLSFDLQTIIDELSKKKLFQAHWNWYKTLIRDAYFNHSREDRIYIATQILLRTMLKAGDALHPVGRFIFEKLCASWEALPVENRSAWRSHEAGVSKAV